MPTGAEPGYPDDVDTRSLVAAALAFVDSRQAPDPNDPAELNLFRAVRTWRKEFPGRATPYPGMGLGVGLAGGSGLR